MPEWLSTTICAEPGIAAPTPKANSVPIADHANGPRKSIAAAGANAAITAVRVQESRHGRRKPRASMNVRVCKPTSPTTPKSAYTVRNWLSTVRGTLSRSRTLALPPGDRFLQNFPPFSKPRYVAYAVQTNVLLCKAQIAKTSREASTRAKGSYAYPCCGDQNSGKSRPATRVPNLNA